jgi:hypothetical protein
MERHAGAVQVCGAVTDCAVSGLKVVYMGQVALSTSQEVGECQACGAASTPAAVAVVVQGKLDVAAVRLLRAALLRVRLLPARTGGGVRGVHRTSASS